MSSKDYSQETIRVKNVSGVLWRDKFDGKTYEILPDDTDRIPIGAYWCWFGNPNAKDFEASKEGAKDRYGDRLPAVWPALVEYIPVVPVATEEAEKAEEAEDAPEAEPAFPGLADIPPRQSPKKK